MINLNVSFKEIEKKPWQDEIPTDEDSYVMRTAYSLHDKRIINFDAEETRFALNQGLHPEFVVWHSLNLLEDNILVETDFYEGSLLITTLRLSHNFWNNNYDAKVRLISILEKNISQLEDNDLLLSVKKDILSAYDDFLNK